MRGAVGRKPAPIGDRQAYSFYIFGF